MKFKKFWEQNKVNILGWGFILLVVVGIVFLAASGNQRRQEAEVSELTVRAGDHISGNPDSQITFIEYADFECPACQYYSLSVLPQLKEEMKDRVKFVFRHFPLTTIHPNAIPAGIASEAASLQGKFQEMYTLLFTNQADWSNASNPNDIFVTYAESIGLDVEKFSADLNNPELEERVRRDLRGGESIGVDSTPSFYINGKKVTGLTGGREIERFTRLIEEAEAAL